MAWDQVIGYALIGLVVILLYFMILRAAKASKEKPAEAEVVQGGHGSRMAPMLRGLSKLALVSSIIGIVVGFWVPGAGLEGLMVFLSGIFSAILLSSLAEALDLLADIRTTIQARSDVDKKGGTA
jgi:hypothetical protein